MEDRAGCLTSVDASLVDRTASALCSADLLPCLTDSDARTAGDSVLLPCLDLDELELRDAAPPPPVEADEAGLELGLDAGLDAGLFTVPALSLLFTLLSLIGEPDLDLPGNLAELELAADGKGRCVWPEAVCD